jgi:hypothetical protein
MLSITNCSQKVTEKEKNKTMTSNNNYTLIYNFPFNGEILINDVVLDKHLYDNLTGTEFINMYILKNGTQKIKIKLYSPQLEKGKLINEYELKKSNEEFALYNTILDNGEISNLQLLQKLNFPNINNPLPVIEHEWSFNAELPFELKGWKNAENLNNWDKDKLEKAVVLKYKQLQELLNIGNTNLFLKELEFANNEYFISNYYNEQKKKAYLSNLIEDFSLLTGKVPILKDYNMRIMGDGKVVVLESLGKYKGLGILTTEDTINKKLYPIYIMLYKPLDSTEFKIVRFFSYKVDMIR